MLDKSQLQTIICTTRIADSERFYSEVLGLAVQARAEGAIVYRIGEAILRLSPVPDLQPSPHTVIGFAVEKLDSTMFELSRRGVSWERFENFPHDDNGVVTTPRGAQVAWFRDPDGNLISLVQF